MTEAEAKTKLCVQTLAPTHDALGGVTYGPAPCVGSSCMAWWWDASDAEWRTGAAVAAIVLGRDDLGADENRDGHCGLAGRPQ